MVTSFYDYDYDVRDRLVKRTDSIDGIARSIDYGYDIASNHTSVITASGTTTYTYDDRNRLDLVKLNGALQADYDYDAASRLTKTTFGNGTEEIREYDSLNRLKTLTDKRGATELAKYVYTLDKVGNRKTAIESVNGLGRTINYDYDDLYRLTGEAIIDATNGDRTSTYVYDKVSNRQTKTVNGTTTLYTYDANDRLRNEKVGSNVTVTYDYDNNGSTTQKVENGVTTTYVWNDEKRLVSATVGTIQVEYVYNDQGIRVSSKQNGVETRYLLDEGIVANVWEEYAPNGTVQASYVYGNDLITQTQAGQTSYYLVDGLGSTRLLTDTQGQVLNAYGYEAFGESTSQSGTASNKYQYAGEQFDAGLGDYYLRQRFYDTSSGRFGRMDTWEGKPDIPLSLNKYIYTHGNPITSTDPSGYTMLAWFFADPFTVTVVTALAVVGAYYVAKASIDVSSALTSAISEAMTEVSRYGEEAVAAALSALTILRNRTDEELRRRRNDLNNWQVIIQTTTGENRMPERHTPALGSRSPVIMEHGGGNRMRLLGTRMRRRDGSINQLIARVDYHPLPNYPTEPFTIHYHLGPTDNGGHHVLWPEQTFIPH